MAELFIILIPGLSPDIIYKPELMHVNETIRFNLL